MRLHRLDLAAFGPYPGHESVDFDALGADGLFLLHGDTGAGKTTLLDAVAFALFGSVPGARGEVRRLRCDYADPQVATEVSLELTVQGHRFRIARSPEYQRPKKRGDGFTTQPAKASLVWLDTPPSGQPSEGLTRIDEVGRTVQRLLGMSADQFFQVVLLPQGDFARFLRAETTEREHLLERLFGTERFAEVEKWFRERRQQRGRDLDDRRKAAAQLVARVAQAAGEEPPEPDAAGEAWLAELRGRLAEAATATAARERDARLACETAEARLAERRALADRVRRVRLATAELAELDEHAGERRAWQEEAVAARRAVPVVTEERAARRLETELRRAETAERDAARAVADLGHPADNLDAAALRRTAGDLQQQAGALGHLVGEADTQQRELARLAALADAERDAGERVADLDRRLAALPERVREARERLDEAAQAEARLEGLRARRDELAAAVADARRLPEVEAEVERAHRERSDAVEAHHAARERLLDLRQRRLDGMAAELAGGLVGGQPCPVCGSAEHPQPARPVADPVGEADEREAAEAEHAAQLRRQAAMEAAQAAEQRRVALLDRLAGRGADELAGALRAVAEEFDRAAELAAQVAARRDAVRALEEEAETLHGRRASAETDRTRVAVDRANLAEVVAERAERLERARGEYPDVAARRRHLLALVDGLNALAEARAARSDAAHRLAEQRDAVTAAALRAGFVDAAEALGAARDDAVLTKLEEQLDEARRREAAARHTLAEPELAGIDPGTEVDLDTAERLARDTRAESETALAALRAAEGRAADVDELAVRLRAAWAELAPAEAEFAELDALTDVVNGRGQNSRRMSLRSYVLAARLAEVAAAATQRLQRMSHGRYAFVHTDEAGPRGTRGGLGLSVLDDYSGRERPAKTLSGGESFLASLSLALGLADVVAAETGGALLDTLFVDEGFGTLDAETLDVVMDALDELRAGGRVVGLVSHVEELRQRIPVRLRVRKARTGSTLHITAG
ncbi:AAA family ATPase [Gandjariella thermophila]|uniref:Nuclease SbcCD subunit C n=1 Tax=Gandjariella thermophila TaxID=1931992 RepID=A0A4D4J3B7_9PSEU|nr:SMC family ATPase [Gandjariella thermophila]GDY29944.1 nuclease SbcCD subunit C [Gandjariella thermophila]